MNLGSTEFLHKLIENYFKQGINFPLHWYGQSKVEILNDAWKRWKSL